MQLSEHFTIWEMVKSQTAVRLGIDNDPNEMQIENMRALCLHVLEPVREHFQSPVIINSGFRNQELNAAINGSKSSQHRCIGKAAAADIEVLGHDNASVAAWIYARGVAGHIPFDQLILEFYTPGHPRSGWVHVSHVRGGPQRGQALTALSENGKTVYRSGLHG